jgi:hypothetical protein
MGVLSLHKNRWYPERKTCAEYKSLVPLFNSKGERQDEKEVSREEKAPLLIFVVEVKPFIEGSL